MAAAPAANRGPAGTARTASTARAAAAMASGTVSRRAATMAAARTVACSVTMVQSSALDPGSIETTRSPTRTPDRQAGLPGTTSATSPSVPLMAPATGTEPRALMAAEMLSARATSAKPSASHRPSVPLEAARCDRGRP